MHTSTIKRMDLKIHYLEGNNDSTICNSTVSSNFEVDLSSTVKLLSKIWQYSNDINKTGGIL